jgi:hypothetical protein
MLYQSAGSVPAVRQDPGQPRSKEGGS